MPPLSPTVRQIRRLLFTDRLSMRQIAEQLGISVIAVRHAIVIDGGVRVLRPTGPFASQENEHDRRSPE